MKNSKKSLLTTNQKKFTICIKALRTFWTSFVTRKCVYMHNESLNYNLKKMKLHHKKFWYNIKNIIFKDKKIKTKLFGFRLNSKRRRNKQMLDLCNKIKINKIQNISWRNINSWDSLYVYNLKHYKVCHSWPWQIGVELLWKRKLFISLAMYNITSLNIWEHCIKLTEINK